MTTITDSLAAVLEQVRVRQGGLSATAYGRDYEADSPAMLIGKLASVLYNRAHVGRTDTEDLPTPRSWRTPDLDAAFAAALPHAASETPVKLAAAPVGGWAVLLIDGVRFRAAAAAVPDGVREGGIFPFTLPPSRPALSPGFYLADGSRGRGRPGGPVLRVYLHLDSPDLAVKTWGAITAELEGAAVPWRAKVSSSPLLYPRRDAMVVYLCGEAWRALHLVRDAADALPLPPQTSPFARRLADGVAVAWDPEDPRPGKRGLSFGEHRCGAVAEALVQHAVGGSGMSLVQHVEASLLDAGVDPGDIWRNLASPELDR
jgi:hypothetical protein